MAGRQRKKEILRCLQKVLVPSSSVSSVTIEVVPIVTSSSSSSLLLELSDLKHIRMQKKENERQWSFFKGKEGPMFKTLLLPPVLPAPWHGIWWPKRPWFSPLIFWEPRPFPGKEIAKHGQHLTREICMFPEKNKKFGGLECTYYLSGFLASLKRFLGRLALLVEIWSGGLAISLRRKIFFVVILIIIMIRSQIVGAVLFTVSN